MSKKEYALIVTQYVFKGDELVEGPQRYDMIRAGKSPYKVAKKTLGSLIGGKVKIRKKDLVLIKDNYIEYRYIAYKSYQGEYLKVDTDHDLPSDTYTITFGVEVYDLVSASLVQDSDGTYAEKSETLHFDHTADNLYGVFGYASYNEFAKAMENADETDDFVFASAIYKALDFADGKALNLLSELIGGITGGDVHTRSQVAEYFTKHIQDRDARMKIYDLVISLYSKDTLEKVAERLAKHFGG